ncbi:MAG: glutathione ABC transporter permease GsiC, partial [Spirochaetaceae bacterium]|nr:glutathione ABC transporter permease GsiC [Spirochaetaceae bacterium]
MQAYVIRRILLLVPTFIILTMLVFLSVRLIPGDVVDATMAQLEFDVQDIDREQVERMLGLDKPIYVQYLN